MTTASVANWLDDMLPADISALSVVLFWQNNTKHMHTYECNAYYTVANLKTLGLILTIILENHEQCE